MANNYQTGESATRDWSAEHPGANRHDGWNGDEGEGEGGAPAETIDSPENLPGAVDTEPIHAVKAANAEVIPGDGRATTEQARSEVARLENDEHRLPEEEQIIPGTVL